MVAHANIVRHMGIDHEKIGRANDRGILTLGQAVGGNALAEKVVVADFQPGRLILIFDILRRLANDAPGIKAIAFSNLRVARDS